MIEMAARFIAAALMLAAMPVAAQSLATPSSDPSRWIGSYDYPRAAFRERDEGAVFALLSVDERARVTECVVTHSSGSQILDDATCATWKRRAQFLAATDAGGTPIKGQYVVMRDWRVEQLGEEFEPTDDRVAYAFCRAIEKQRPGTATRRVFVSSIRTLRFRDVEAMQHYGNGAAQDAWRAYLDRKGVAADAWAYCSWQFGRSDARADRAWLMGKGAPPSFRSTAFDWVPPQ